MSHVVAITLLYYGSVLHQIILDVNQPPTGADRNLFREQNKPSQFVTTYLHITYPEAIVCVVRLVLVLCDDWGCFSQSICQCFGEGGFFVYTFDGVVAGSGVARLE